MAPQVQPSYKNVRIGRTGVKDDAYSGFSRRIRDCGLEGTTTAEVEAEARKTGAGTTIRGSGMVGEGTTAEGGTTGESGTTVAMC